MALVELVLALFGVKGYEPLVVPWGKQFREPIFRLTERDGQRLWAPDPQAETEHKAQSFPADKPERSYRVFCLGASTVHGTPYGPRSAFPAWLQAGLKASGKWRNVEVVNCGSPSITSYRVLWNLREVVRHEPDLIVIYTGHNEGWASPRNEHLVESYPWLVGVQETLQGLRLYGVARRAALATATRMQRGRFAKPKWSEKRNQAMADNYARHIAEMVSTARANSVPVVFCTLVSNLRDWPPFGSRRIELPSKDAKRWDKAYQAGLLKLSAGDAHGAMEEFKFASSLDPWHADTYFRVGRCMEAMGDFGIAGKMYAAAKDFDEKPVRAIESLSTHIRGLAEERGVVVADVEAAFKERSEHGLVGDDMMLDNCHPASAGHRIAAETILTALAARSIVPDDGPTRNAIRRSLDDFERSIKPTPAEEAKAKVFVAASRFDGRPLLSDRLAGYREAIQLLEDALLLDPSARRAHLFLGMAYGNLSYETRDADAYARARQALEAAARRDPRDPFAPQLLRQLAQSPRGLTRPLSLTP